MKGLFFSSLGLQMNVAKVLTLLSKGGYCSSMEIKERTKLRQSDVSLAVPELQRRGWVTEKRTKKGGEGEGLLMPTD